MIDCYKVFEIIVVVLLEGFIVEVFDLVGCGMLVILILIKWFCDSCDGWNWMLVCNKVNIFMGVMVG